MKKGMNKYLLIVAFLIFLKVKGIETLKNDPLEILTFAWIGCLFIKDLNQHLFLLGFLGFFGFTELKSDPLGLLAFSWFAYFSHYWWNKLGTCKDERLIYNKNRAGSIALYTGFVLAVVASVLVRLVTVDILTLYRAQVLILSLTFAIAMNLWAFLTYRFDLGN